MTRGNNILCSWAILLHNKYMPCLEWFLSLVIGLDIEEKSHINFRICFFPHVRPESILRNGTLRG